MNKSTRAAIERHALAEYWREVAVIRLRYLASILA